MLHRAILTYKQHFSIHMHIVFSFVSTSAKLGTCTVVSVNGTLAEDKMSRFKGECAQFNLNKCPIYTHNSARAKLSTNSYETDNSAVL
jgi:hypothetical protein